MKRNKIILELSSSEALVLFDFLSRFSERGSVEIVDQSEERILWDLCSDLEEKLVEPLAKNYNELLVKAREEVRDKTNKM